MIGVVGLGFVGLTTALGFAHKGYKVHACDISAQKTDALRRGKVLFYEPHLEQYLKKYQGKRFFLCDNLADVVDKSQVIFFCVGTPSDARGEADLGFLKAAVFDSLQSMKKRSKKVFVIKSTVPPSTVSCVVHGWIKRAGFKPGVDVGVASNPEFLREGCAWEDCIHPKRIVIGADDSKTARIMRRVYASFGAPIRIVSLNTAEFIKYLSNCLLATMISFSNEMTVLAEEVGGVAVPAAFRILYEDKRWSGKPASMTSYVYPGCGFGGYCLPKDARAMMRLAQKRGSQMRILESVLQVNEDIKDHVVGKIIRVARKNDFIGIMGLAFKPGTDDVRDSPALSVIRRLLAQGFRKIMVYDPVAADVFRTAYGLPVIYAGSLKEIAAAAKVLVLLTSWPEFKSNAALFKGKSLIDGRYFLSEKDI